MKSELIDPHARHALGSKQAICANVHTARARASAIITLTFEPYRSYKFPHVIRGTTDVMTSRLFK